MACIDHDTVIRHCVNILNTFHPDDVALEEHYFNYLDSSAANEDNMNDDMASFLEVVFVGCQKYSRILDVVLSGYYAKDGQRSLRSEQNLLRVFTYLSLFRMEDIGMAQFNRYVRSQDVHKMYKFLNFLYNEKHIKTWMRDEWNKIYDYSFVQTTVIAPLIGYLPELLEIVKQLKDKIDNKKELKKPTIKSTEMKPFNLYKPRPRTIKMPDPIPKLKKHSPVPQTTYETPKEHHIINNMKEKNRRTAEVHFMEASRVQFACANPNKSNKTKQRLNDIMAEEDSKLDFERHKSNPLPSNMLTQNIPIRLNAAAILREGKLYQKKEAEELKKLEDLEAGAGDSSKFLEWQKKMRQQDLDEQLADVERRRIEGKLSMEEAILARNKLMKENKQKVLDMKEEAAELMRIFMEKKLIEEQETRQLVENVMEGHENAKEAKKRIQEYKAKIVQEVTEKNKEDMRRALEEAEIEMRQKMELIQQIRAMEAVPIIRKKLVNLTETAGYGLLSEMSIAELRERIDLLKVSQLEEEEQKRDEIIAKKQAKEKMLNATLDTITRHRTEQTRAASNKLETHKTTRHLKPEIKDPKIGELQKKLEAKRAERLKEQENAKITVDRVSANRLKQLGRDKKNCEQARWQELEQRQQRLARLNSNNIHKSQSASRMATNNISIVT